MTEYSPQHQPPDEHDDPHGIADADTWTDNDGQEWEVIATQHSIHLDGPERIVIPADRFERDIIITELSPGRIAVRFSTFKQEVTFVVSQDQFDLLATRLLRRVPAAPAAEREASDTHLPGFPRVSRLSVWALITAALSFLPIVGWFAAATSVTLLLMHWSRIPKSSAWRHSRRLCQVALAFLVIGIPVSIRATVHEATQDEVDVVLKKLQPIAENAEPARDSDDIDWSLLAAGLLVLLLSLSIHEGAHAVTAWWMGDDLAYRLGRVTLNPLSHIDPVGTVLLPLILFISKIGVFGWARPVPTDVSRCRSPRRAHILIALAGPGSNLLLAAASITWYIAIGFLISSYYPEARLDGYNGFGLNNVRVSGVPMAPGVGALLTMLNLSFLINVFLAFFNLIPIPPLDGSWVLEHLFPQTCGPLYQRIRPYGFILFIGLIYTNVLGTLLIPAFFVIYGGVYILVWYTPW